ncbi:hypothetical protein F5X96DRAFT_681084 [Biscogniauxia mediterranea]|nr:hypothetical protein F5X96DRAFT_681084 [Biscogniauxia mediterranea]
MKFAFASLAIVGLFTSTAHCISTTNFDHFFPAWNDKIQEILRNNCSEELATYREGKVDPTQPKSALVTPVIECILNAFPEYRKAEMASSAVVLGLLPTILQSLGSTAAETALLGLRRPVLAFLLSAGSPAVSTMKGSEFVETVATFVEGGDPRGLAIPGFTWSRIPSSMRALVSFFEYLLVGAAVANVVDLAYELGRHAIVAFAPETIFCMPLWTFLAIVIHFAGVIALSVRVKVRNVGDGDGEHYHRRATGFHDWIPNELVPAAFQPWRLQWRKETLWFQVLSWGLSVGIVAHVLWGTLVLSSLLFFSVTDSLVIVSRYIASTLVCRGIVRLELSGMRGMTNYQRTEATVQDDELEYTMGMKRHDQTEMSQY